MRSEAFSDVQLDVAAAASVEEALRGFVAWETMEGPDSWCAAPRARPVPMRNHLMDLTGVEGGCHRAASRL